MDIQIKEVTTKAEIKAFINFPDELYKDHPCFVPSLRFDESATLSPEKNPAFDYCEARYWLAYKNNKVVGRIAGIINNAYIDKWKNKYIRFGWIDFEDDINISRLLLKEVENWAKGKGLNAMHGPLGFTDLDHEGTLIEGFDQLGTLASIYNHPYYQNHFEQLGFDKETDWVEYKIAVDKVVPERIIKLASIVERRLKLTVIRAKKPKEILRYATAIFELINDTYADLFGVTALTRRQMDYYTKQYFSFMKVDYVTIIVDSEGKLAAFNITMPSLSRALQKNRGKLLPFGFIPLLKAMKKNDMADLLMVAIRKDLQGKGVNAMLMKATYDTYIKNGVTTVETNHELEDNTKVQSLWENFNVEQHKRRRCFIKHFPCAAE
jgi:GNAT superfamily N-acetyltransferase